MSDNPLLESLFVTVSSRSLSSVASDLGVFETENAVQQKVSGYRPRDGNNDTVKVLKSLLQYLPCDGRRNIATFIANAKTTNEHLFALAEHLASAILCPL